MRSAENDFFYEKANKTILQECKDFIKQNKATTENYYVYCDALSLYAKLSQSLIDSHKDFDEAIKKELNKSIFLDNGAENCYRIARFNKANYGVIPDAEAHQALEQLKRIQMNNEKQVIKR